MEQQQFSRNVLAMIHVQGQTRLRAAEVARRLQLAERDAESMLDRMVTEGELELDSDDDGNLFYFVPGMGVAGVFNPGAALGPSIGTPRPESNASGPPAWNAPQGGPQGWQGASPGGWPQPGPPAQGAAPAGLAWPQKGPGPGGAGWPTHGGPPSPQGAWPAAPPQGAWQAPPNPTPGWQPGAPQPGAWSPPSPAGGWQQGGAGPGPAGPQGSYPGPTGGWSQPGPTGPAWNAPQPGPQGGAWQVHSQQPSYGPSHPQHHGHPHAHHGHQGNAPGAWNVPPQHAMTPWQGNAYPVSPNAPGGREYKSPTMAALLSLFFPGAGQLYNGQVGKGLTFFFLTFALFAVFPFGLIPWVWSMVDAHETSRRMNTSYGLLPP